MLTYAYAARAEAGLARMQAAADVSNKVWELKAQEVHFFFLLPMKPAEHLLRAASVSYRIRRRLLPHAPTHVAYVIRLCALWMQVLTLGADRLRILLRQQLTYADA
jgi:hypothetical protein